MKITHIVSTAENKELAGRPIDEQTAMGKKVSVKQMAYRECFNSLLVGEYTPRDSSRYARCHCHYGKLSRTTGRILCDRYEPLSIAMRI